MATQLFFTNTAPDFSRGSHDTNLLGTTEAWTPLSLSTSRGAGVQSATVSPGGAGPTPGLEVRNASVIQLEWITGPLDADTTISGSITANLWGLESSMNNNAGLGVIIERLNTQGAVVSTVMQNNAIGIELGTTSAVRNEATSPTSTNMLKGERLRVRVYVDDGEAVTLVAGGTNTFRYAHTAGAADGDSYVTFTEDFGFLTALPGSSLQQTTYNFDTAFGQTATVRVAQPFTAPDSGTLTSITVDLSKVGTPADNVEIALQADSSGSPSGSDLASASLAGGSITGTHATYAFDIADTVIAAGTKYWIVYRRSGATSDVNYFRAGANAGGSLGKFYNGSSWALGAFDTYYTTAYTNGTTALYLTNTSSAVDPNGASYDAKEAWTARGAGVQTASINDAAGPTAPLLATASLGGNFVEWFTKGLTAFTLNGLVSCNIRANETSASSNAAVRCEIAVTATDGTSPTIWGASNDGVELGTSEAAMTFAIAGDSTAITDGQRLRIRIYYDDAPGVAMANAGDLKLYYAGTSAAASGDTYITLPATVTEFTSSPNADVTPTTVAATTTVSADTVNANADTTPVTVAGQVTAFSPTVTADANVTPTTVVAAAFIDTPTVSGNADITLTTVTAQATVDTPTVDTVTAQDANVTPTTVASQATVASTAAADLNVSPDTVVAMAFIDTPSVVATSPNADVTPATVAAFVAIDVPQVVGNANAPPSEVAAVAAIPTPSISLDSTVTPTTVVAVAAVTSPTITADANSTLTTVVGQATVPTPAISLDSTATPTTVTAQAFVETPSVSAGGSVNVTPTTVAAQASLDISTISVIQNPTVTPDTVAASTAVSSPTVTADGNVTAGNVASTTSVGVPITTADANLSTGNVTTQATVPGSSVTGTADVTTSTVVSQTTTPGVTVSATQSPTITLTTVVGTASVEIPNVQASGDVQVTLVTVVASASVPGVSVAADAGPTAGDVGATASLDTPTITADAEVEAGTQAQAQVPTPGIIILASGDVLVSLETLALSASVPGVSVSILPYEWLGEMGTEWTGRTTPEWEQQDGGQEWPVGVGTEWP